MRPHIASYKTIFNYLLSIRLVKGSKGCFWSTGFGLRNWDILEINNINILLLRLFLFIRNSDLFGNYSCRFGSSFLLSFGSTFLFSPLEHFIFKNSILLIFSNHFVSLFNVLMNSFNIIESIVWKISLMLNKCF